MELDNTQLNEDFAVIVDDAYKSYGEVVVLNGLKMRVQQGTIYGLLGPSGCGKTTLLACLVGRRNLDSGVITLKVKKKSEVGYMPQELSLFTDFSIKETMIYFGKIFGMTGESLESRSQELIKMLELPSETCLIKELSGGQQRRVSFCVALLHNPELLILDEPTVGVDPLLSQSIWQKLLEISTIQKKTIIITTHYIEEARMAHTIGLMRGGKLLAEENPNALIHQYNCETLENVFLKLSYNQIADETDQFEKETQARSYFKKPVKKRDLPLNSGDKFSMRRVNAQFYKSLFWMKRNIPVMMFLLGLPFIQCALFNLAIGQDPIGLRVGVVNDEFNSWKTSCQELQITCGESPLSCLFLTSLKNKDISLVEFDDLEVAKRAVKSNNIWGMIHFNNNFTESLLERITERNIEEEVIESSLANVWMDMSNQYIGNMIKWDLIKGYNDFMENVFEVCNWPRKGGRIPIKFQEAVYGSNNPSFAHFAVPAVLQLFEFYLPLMFTVGAIVLEKKGGNLERSLVSGITLQETLLAHIVVQYALLALQTVIMLLVLFVMFDNPFEGSLILSLFLLFLIGTNGMCYGFFISTFCDSETTATLMALGSFFPVALLSGMLWPIQGMHYILRNVGILLPLTLTTESMRAIMMRSWSISHPVIYKGFLSTVLWILIFSVLTIILARIQNGINRK